jgi:glycosyltransferase involved in cell wall biosynthesis
VIVVPLRANTHASGLTVLLESVALGKPVIVTDVGGLRDYFGTGHVSYVPAHDSAALRRTLDELRANPSLALARAQAALRHFIARDYTTREFALQHVRLTRDALGRGRGASEAATPAQAVFASHELTR